ncbi:hypothetical protein AVEN_14257-1 [Araneus ventricosus]|uniref:Uncharacterized protein n=1 Tax=Araneus ventricosus TaxID=182803 RepID=A0A4Y2TDZ8_ARAVE|nr:hypothetical protein AVEN_14257-1 [Araneus ventricosus]
MGNQSELACYGVNGRKSNTSQFPSFHSVWKGALSSVNAEIVWGVCRLGRRDLGSNLLSSPMGSERQPVDESTWCKVVISGRLNGRLGNGVALSDWPYS